MQFRSTKSYGSNQIKMLVYGQPGVGKTTLATTTEEPTLVISAESGLLSIADHDLSYLDVTQDEQGNKLSSSTAKMDRIQQVAQFLASEEGRKQFTWIVIDSLTEIGQIVYESIKESDAKFKDPKNNLQLWGMYGERMRALIKFFRDLPGYNVVFTALAKSEKDELNRKIMAVDLQGKISEQLPGYFDEVFYYEVTDTEEKEKLRHLVTQPSDKFVAKDRSGKLGIYEKPNLKLIAQKIKGGTNV